jgi:4-hydroxy-tetrahydrodipicolinate synthase
MRAAQPTMLERGVWGILATPFLPDGDVDVASLAREVTWFADVGARGVVALGVFGEAAKLDDDERALVARTVLAAAATRGLGVVLGVTTLATAPTLAQTRTAVTLAAEAAATGDVPIDRLLRGVMVQVPSADRDLLRAHLAELHESTGVGLVVQDYPVASGVRIPAALLGEVVASLPGIVAVKAESTPTAPAVAALVGACDVPVFGGLGGVALIDELALGAAGAMTGFSFPEGLVATVDAYAAGGVDAARATWSRFLPMAVFEQQDGLALAIRKAALVRRGIIAHAVVRPPGPRPPASILPLLDAHLDDLMSHLATRAAPADH